MTMGAIRIGSRIARIGGHSLGVLAQNKSALPHPLLRNEQMAETCRLVCQTHKIDIRVSGPIPEAPALIVANHVSYMDPLILLTVAPASPVAKGEVESWPFIGDVCRSLGVYFVRRECKLSGAKTLRRARKHLLAGGSVLNFPEGTTTHGDRLLPFHRGTFGIAKMCNVPVWPVVMRYFPADMNWVGDSTFFPHYLRTLARPSWHCAVRFGQPIPSRQYRDANHLAAASYSAMHKLLSDLNNRNQP